MSRRIKLGHVNVVLFAIIAIVLIVYGRELRWAASELPGYLDGTFSETPERQLYLEAADILRDGDDIDRALPLLQRSLEIDGRGEAGFWLGLYYELSGDDTQALAIYTEYLETDPVLLPTYLQAAGIHRRAERIAEARAMLQRGLTYYEKHTEQYLPFLDRSASPEHNNKARQTYAQYKDAQVTLKRALGSLDPADAKPPSLEQQ